MKRIFVTMKKAPSEDMTTYYWDPVRACLKEETAKRLIAEEKERQEKLEELRKQHGATLPCWIPRAYDKPWVEHGGVRYETLGSDGRYYSSQENADLAERTRTFEAREEVKALYASFTMEECYEKLEVVD